MTLLRLAHILIFAATISSVAQDSADAASSAKKPDTPSAISNDPRVRGAHVFSDSGCQQCHTIRDIGGKKGPDLSSVGRRLNEEQIRTQILHGGKQMPAFADVLQTSETDDLVAYLHSLRDKQQKKK
jgi:mono/diheme cytochrome c family protein